MMRGLRLYCSAKVTIPDHRKSPLDQLRVEHHIVTGIEQHAGTRVGEVRRVQTRAQLRLRIGNWRVFFKWVDDGTIKIVAILHRREAYR